MMNRVATAALIEERRACELGKQYRGKIAENRSPGISELIRSEKDRAWTGGGCRIVFRLLLESAERFIILRFYLNTKSNSFNVFLTSVPKKDSLKIRL